MAKHTKKKALITGITGFAGSHLAELLLTEGVDVHGIQRWRSKSDNIEDIKDKIIFHEADLLDAHSLYKVIDEVRPNYIFHLAAQSYVQSSWGSPSNTLEVNVIGTCHLFEAVKKSGLNTPIQIACSSEEYGKVLQNELPIKETNPLRPLSPYAVSKRAGELYAEVFSEIYNMDIIGLRYFNIFGPRQNPNGAYAAAIPLFIDALLSNKSPVIYGNGEQTRDFTFVENAVQANIKAMFTENTNVKGRIFNIAAGKMISLNDLIIILSKLTGSEINAVYKKERAGDVRKSLADITKAKAFLGYEPHIQFEEGLKCTLDWFANRK